MTWSVVFVLAVIAFPVVFFAVIGIVEHRQNVDVRRSPNSVQALRRRIKQQRDLDVRTRSTEP